MSDSEKYSELFSKACELMEGLIHLDGQPGKPLNFFSKRKLRKAKSTFLSAIKLSPDNAAPYLMIAKIDDRFKNFKSSIEWLDKAWQLEPNSLIIAVELSSILGQYGKHEKAIKVLNQALLSYPEEPRLLYNMGLSFLFTDRTEDAVVYFEKTVQVEPDYSMNYKLLEYAKKVANGDKSSPKDLKDLMKNL